MGRSTRRRRSRPGSKRTGVARLVLFLPRRLRFSPEYARVETGDFHVSLLSHLLKIGSFHSMTRPKARRKPYDAARSRLDVAIYSMDTIRTARLDDYVKMMPSTVHEYAKQEKFNITVATLPDGTVDWPTTLGSDPNVSGRSQKTKL